MPRPKRSKVVPSAPAQLPKTKQSSGAQLQSRLSSPSTRTCTNSDDSEGIVKRNKSGANRRGIMRQHVEMSGALHKPSQELTRPTAGSETLASSELSGSRQNGSTHAPKVMDINGVQSQDNEIEVYVPSSFPNEGRISHSKPPFTGNKDQDLVSSASELVRAPLSQKSQATPLADSSILSLAKFKRRPRQPSLLGIGRPDDSLSLSSLAGLDHDDASVDIPESLERNAGDLTVADDLSDFEPENESTPFNLAKTDRARESDMPADQDINPSPSVSEDRSSVYDDHGKEAESPGSAFESQLGKEPPTPSRDNLNGKRKRKLTPPEVQVPRSQQSPTHSVEALEDSFLPSPKRLSLSSPNALNEVMAPPMSSSPVRSLPHEDGTQVSQSEPLATHKRGRPKHERPLGSGISTRTKRLKASQPVSTAELQTLMPRRRTTRHNNDEFDIYNDASSNQPSDDEDELSYLGPGKRKTARRHSISKGGRQVLSATKTPKANVGLRAHNVIAGTASNSTQKRAPNNLESRKPKRFYGKRSSGQENDLDLTSSGSFEHNDSLHAALDGDGGIEGTGTIMTIQAQKEMKRLAEKFKQVDDWKMEFEEVTASSSPKDAR